MPEHTLTTVGIKTNIMGHFLPFCYFHEDCSWLRITEERKKKFKSNIVNIAHCLSQVLLKNYSNYVEGSPVREPFKVSRSMSLCLQLETWIMDRLLLSSIINRDKAAVYVSFSILQGSRYICNTYSNNFFTFDGMDRTVRSSQSCGGGVLEYN